MLAKLSVLVTPAMLNPFALLPGVTVGLVLIGPTGVLLVIGPLLVALGRVVGVLGLLDVPLLDVPLKVGGYVLFGLVASVLFLVQVLVVPVVLVGLPLVLLGNLILLMRSGFPLPRTPLSIMTVVLAVVMVVVVFRM